MLFPVLSGFGATRPVIGLDLEPPTARLMAGRRRGRRWRVEACSARDLPTACLQEGRITQFEPLAEVLRAWLAEAGLAPSPRVALALSGPQLQRLPLTLPADLRPWRWRRWLQAQAETLAQAPLHDIAWAVEVQPGRPPQLWLSACPLAWVEDWQGLAEAVGMALVRLDDRERLRRQVERAGDRGMASLDWAQGLTPRPDLDFSVALGLARG